MRKKVVPGDKVLYCYDKNTILTSSKKVSLCEVISVYTVKTGKLPWKRETGYVLWDFEDDCKRTVGASSCVYIDDDMTKKIMELEADAMANNKNKKKKEGEIYL